MSVSFNEYIFTSKGWLAISDDVSYFHKLHLGLENTLMSVFVLLATTRLLVVCTDGEIWLPCC